MFLLLSPIKGLFDKSSVKVIEAAETGLSNTELVQKAATMAEDAVGGAGRFTGTAKLNS